MNDLFTIFYANYQSTVSGRVLLTRDLLSACREKLHIDIRKVKITAKFQCLKRVFIEDTKGFMTPEKFRDVRETGPNRVNQLNSQ